jgi:copper homeostasis protein (lipoprotein)
MKNIGLILLCCWMFLACNNNSTNTTETSTATTPTAAAEEGTYEGVLPCADCEGLKTTIDLKADHEALISSTYMGKIDTPIVDKATWEMLDQKVLIHFGGITMQYEKGADYIKQLDGEGKVIEGDLAEHFILKKVK